MLQADERIPISHEPRRLVLPCGISLQRLIHVHYRTSENDIDRDYLVHGRARCNRGLQQIEPLRSCYTLIKTRTLARISSLRSIRTRNIITYLLTRRGQKNIYGSSLRRSLKKIVVLLKWAVEMAQRQIFCINLVSL